MIMMRNTKEGADHQEADHQGADLQETEETETNISLKEWYNNRFRGSMLSKFQCRSSNIIPNRISKMVNL